MDIHDFYPMGEEIRIDPKIAAENTVRHLEELLENCSPTRRKAVEHQLGQVKAKLAAM